MARVKGSKVPVVPKGAELGPAKPDVRRVKLTLRVETIRRLQVLGLGLGVDSLGQLLDDLVMGQPQRFVLQDRGTKVSGGPSVDPVAAVAPGDRAPGVQEVRPGPVGLQLVREVG